MWGWRSSRTIVVGAAIGAFSVFCILPLAYMIAVALSETGRAALYADLFLDYRQRALLFNTAILGVGTAVAATVIGVPLGVALARLALPFKAGLRIVLAAPALIPSYIVGLAWLYFGGPEGLPAALFVLTVLLYPLSMLIAESAIRGVEPSLEEAASLAAKPGRVLWRITLPLVVPSVLAAALIVFVLAVSDFGVPALLRARVFTTEIRSLARRGRSDDRLRSSLHAGSADRRARDRSSLRELVGRRGARLRGCHPQQPDAGRGRRDDRVRGGVMARLCPRANDGRRRSGG